MTDEEVDEPNDGAFVSVFEPEADPDPDDDAELEPLEREALAVALTEAGEEPDLEADPELEDAELAGEFEVESVFPILPRTSLRLSLEDMMFWEV